LLRSHGIRVDEVTNGQEALEIVQKHDYDAVLMDIQMPIMGGHEAARRIRALAETPGQERYARLPIIAMTALAMAQDAERSQAAGMNDHVTKPVAPERLMAVLAKWIKPGSFKPDRAPAPALPAAPRALPPDMLALTSLDALEGVRRIGGRVEAYRKQLRRFREHYPDAVSGLQRLLAAGEIQGAEEYCHALKGITGNIGAMALFEQISAIDNRLKQGETPDVATLEALRAALHQVMQEIDHLGATASQTPSTTAPPLTDGQILDTLDALAHALEYDLGAAEPLLVELRAGVREPRWAEDIAAIAVHVDHFDIDLAKPLLTQLRDRIKPRTAT
jgi:two-component system, sensor histidine kinase and response regulator